MPCSCSCLNYYNRQVRTKKIAHQWAPNDDKLGPLLLFLRPSWENTKDKEFCNEVLCNITRPWVIYDSSTFQAGNLNLVREKTWLFCKYYIVYRLIKSNVIFYLSKKNVIEILRSKFKVLIIKIIYFLVRFGSARL